MLPHFSQLSMTGSPGGPGTKPQEVVYTNLFEVTFILPLILQAQGRDPLLLLEQALKINLDLTSDIEYSTQNFKYSTRNFMNTPSSTSKEIDIDFNVNVNEAGSMETWNTLKAWYDLVWNNNDGTAHYKSDIIGAIIVNQHDKKGVVLRRVTYVNAQIMGVSGIDLSWESSDIWKNVNAKWICDTWADEYIDSNFVIEPPFVAGYL